MKIKDIQTVRINVPQRDIKRTEPRREAWNVHAEVIANPMSRYPQYKRHRSSWMPKDVGPRSTSKSPLKTALGA